jgi:Restriction endonuclease
MMFKKRNSGKALENLVAFVEKLSLPDGFSVETNKRIRNESGNDEAEFDIVISGKIGSANMVWLIECRDRPSGGSAPVSWIEQLVGRQDRFQINKITAVSTQTFSKPARKLAALKGIDLRQIKSLSVNEFQDWLRMPSYQQATRFTDLKHAGIIVSDDLPEAIGYAAGKLVQDARPGQPFLRSTANGTLLHPKDAFAGIVELHNLFEGVEPNGASKQVNLNVQYTNPLDRFEIDTDLGPAAIESIRFQGELSIKEVQVPLKSVFEYHDVDSSLPISQTATYESQPIGDNHWALTLHKDQKSGETQIMLVAAKPTTI